MSDPLINGERSEYIIPLDRKEFCAQCDPTATARRAWRQMKSGQDTVRCRDCGAYLYCIPKAQSGLPRRSVKTRPDVDLSVRAEVFERDRSKCLMCGRTPEDDVVLHLSHFVSIDDCKLHGVPEDAWNAEYNMCLLCEECNLSQGNRSWHPVHLIARLIIARRRWVNHPKYRAWVAAGEK